MFKYFKKLFLKWKIKFRRKLSYRLSVDIEPTQKKAISITEAAIRNSKSNLFMTTSKHYIRLKDIFIVIGDRYINIINGKYNYDVYITDKMHTHILRKFRKSLDTRVNKIEDQICSKVSNILDDIHEDIVKEPKNKETNGE